jgi:hypothetical protein
MHKDGLARAYCATDANCEHSYQRPLADRPILWCELCGNVVGDRQPRQDLAAERLANRRAGYAQPDLFAR